MSMTPEELLQLVHSYGHYFDGQIDVNILQAPYGWVVITEKNFASLIEEVQKQNADRIKILETAVSNARQFASLVEVWGRTDCEIYKHELKVSADLCLERTNVLKEDDL